MSLEKPFAIKNHLDFRRYQKAIDALVERIKALKKVKGGKRNRGLLVIQELIEHLYFLLVRKEPDLLADYLGILVVAFLEENFPEPAIQWLTQAINLNPHNQYVIVAEARYAEFLGRTIQAKNKLMEAISKTPTNRFYRKALREMAERNNDYSELVEFYEKRLVVQEEMVFHAELAGLYKVQGKIQEALKHYEAVALVNPEHGKATKNMVNLLAIFDDWSRIDELFSTVVEKHPQALQFRLEVARAMQEQGLNDQAEKIYRQALAIDPQSLKAYDGLMEIYQARGDYHQAEQCFTQAIRLDPHNYHRLQKLALMQYRFERFNDALEAITVALHLNPKTVYGRVLRANILRKLKRYQEAIRECEELITSDLSSIENDTLKICYGFSYLELYKQTHDINHFRFCETALLEIYSNNPTACCGLVFLYVEEAEHFQHCEPATVKRVDEYLDLARSLDPATKDLPSAQRRVEVMKKWCG